ncbi:MAG: penicillin acylase family protein [Thaumarchaeota archaeon]|nr:penicillin acylase family protein [Candidatus Calditenuaceae archaeon]MDW8187037.1 penicillin acylase family protein [Nitrososphaerota archaeon]
MNRRIWIDLAVSAFSGALVIALMLASGPFGLLHPMKGIWTETERVKSGDATLMLSGLRSEVKVVYDVRNVPHIFASDELDAIMTLGYLHARDRLWQMDVQRRLASGRLAEVVGESALKSDVVMRVIGLHRSARSTAEWLSENHPEVYSFLTAYAQGVNSAIEEMRVSGRVPLMFKLLGYEPEPWRPEDSLVWAKYMGWTLTGFWYPLVLTALAGRIGSLEVMKLYPVRHYYSENATVVPGDGSVGGLSLSVNPDELGTLDWFGKWASGLDLTDEELSRKIFELVDWLSEFVELSQSYLGSNNWVISPELSATGGPMLADDPHLPLTLPSLWYEVHLVAEELNVRGVTLAGIPFVIIGFNEHVAWGLTNSQIGVTDFYLEKVQGSRFYFRGEWRDMLRLEEVIEVGADRDYRLTVNLTVHGPIFHHRGVHVSLRWTAISGFENDGTGVTREAVAAYRVIRAKSLTEAYEALEYWDVPSQNWAVIDRHGNYGIIVPGLFPYRTVNLPSGESVKVIGSRSVLNGTGDFEWEGYVPFELVPKVVNPTTGYAAAPNQQTTGKFYPYYILAGWYDPGARAQRIHALLSSKKLHSIEDLTNYQNDVYLWFAASTVPPLLELAMRFDGLSELERKALEELRRWDYQMNRDLAGPTVWWAWFSALYDEAFGRRFAERGITKRYLPPESTLVWLIQNDPQSTWFGGDLLMTARSAFSRAVTWLSSKLGGDPSEWTWGKVHKLRIGHLSSLDALSIGPLPFDGSSGTLMNAGFPYDLRAGEGQVYVTTGPSWRMIVTFVEGRVVAYGVYPGGQSESPISEHYSDSFDEWYGSKYHELKLPDSPNEVDGRLMTLTFKSGGL